MNIYKNIHLYFPLACFALFVFISILSLRDQLLAVDYRIIDALATSNPLVSQAMVGVTQIGSSEAILLVTVFVSFFLLYFRLWRETAFLYVLTIGGIALNFLLKIAFQRERPGELKSIELFDVSLEIASCSFPSGHTMRSVLLFTFLIYIIHHIMKRASIRISVIAALASIILLVALSRIIVGAHFPSDIAAAMAISISWFYLCLSLFRNKLSFHHPDRKELPDMP